MITTTIRKTTDLFAIDHVRVIDGDTIEALIYLPFDVTTTKRIRLRGWWADEPFGLHAATGQKARSLLHEFCVGKALWISCSAERLDRYGRVLAHLVHDEKMVNPKDVLGDCLLTEAEHRRRRDSELKASGRTSGKLRPSGARDTAHPASKRAGGPIALAWRCSSCGSDGAINTGCVDCCPKPPYRF